MKMAPYGPQTVRLSMARRLKGVPIQDLRAYTTLTKTITPCQKPCSHPP